MEIGTRLDSINLDHHNKQAISVLGFGLLYLKDDKTIAKVYFDYLSEILNHDSGYAGGFLIDLISTELFKKFTKIDIWADTGNHFKSQEFLHYIFKQIPKMNSSLNVDLNFFAEHDGKSIVDGHFGNLSKWENSFEASGKIEDIDQLISRFETFTCEHGKINNLTIDNGKTDIIFKKYERNKNTK